MQEMRIFQFIDGVYEMRSTYKEDDVILLLKDITGKVEPLGTKEREKAIQSGKHYCEMLPLEYKPSDQYIQLYNRMLEVFAKPTADAVARVAEEIYRIKGKRLALVSLARAGTSIGVLIKRYIKNKYDVNVPHYSISIIRDRGIDKNAMKYILERHCGNDIQFVDGWVGKGAIFKELESALEDFPDVDGSLAVLADPAHITDLCGTHDDILIPSSCLNSTVSGLVSRTFLRHDIIADDDFHGAAYYEDLLSEDRTYEFINVIEKHFEYGLSSIEHIIDNSGIDVVNKIKEEYGVKSINFVKPGIGETTRVLLRRVPWRVLVSNADKNAEELQHIIQLANEKGVEIYYCNLKNYKCCGIIKNLEDA